MSKNWRGGSRKGSRYIGKRCACLALNDAHENGCRGRRALRVPCSTHFFFFFARMHERQFMRGTARSRAWNVLPRVYAFSPLKCWFDSVFKRNRFSRFHCTLGSGSNLLKSLFFQRSASLTRFRSELFKFGASVPVF